MLYYSFSLEIGQKDRHGCENNCPTVCTKDQERCEDGWMDDTMQCSKPLICVDKTGLPLIDNNQIENCHATSNRFLGFAPMRKMSRMKKDYLINRHCCRDNQILNWSLHLDTMPVKRKRETDGTFLLVVLYTIHISQYDLIKFRRDKLFILLSSFKNSNLWWKGKAQGNF